MAITGLLPDDADPRARAAAVAAAAAADTKGCEIVKHSRFDSSVLAEFLIAARASPNGVALAALDNEGEVRYELSFGQLLAWSASVLHDIVAAAPALGVRGGSAAEVAADPSALRLVALVMERSPVVIAAKFAVWRLGAAIAAMPHDAPASRLEALCAGVAAVIVDADGAGPSSMRGPAPVVALAAEPPRSLGTALPALAAPWTDELPSPVDPCMVVYTSGSTGVPKGVLCSHKSLWHSVCCYGESIEVSSTSRLLWKTPYQWRTAEYEIYPPICAGGTIYVAPDGANRRLDYLVRTISKHGINAVTTVPTVLAPLSQLLAEQSTAASALRHVAAVGEPLPAVVCGAFLGGSTRLLQNYYGLTETGMTQWLCNRMPETVVAPAGCPQPCVTVHILGPDGTETASGEGEVHFGGVMSEGYLNDAAMNASRFVSHAPAPLGVAFRSGDLGRWNSFGELEVLGRIDRQIKLHGVRVELGEIEAALLERCREAVVVPAMEDSQTLVAFFAGDLGQVEALRSHLSTKLPPYMVPLHFIALEALPRLPTEKVDQAQLRGRTAGLMTRAAAKRRLEEGGAAEDVGELVRYVDSLGFTRAISSKKAAARRLWDNLMVLGMVNVILYHWYWCVLVDPRTYLPPWEGYPFGYTVPLPHIPVAAWVMGLFRILTQEWINGVFVFAAVQVQSPEELKRFTYRDWATLGLYVYIGALPMVISLFCPSPWDGYVFRAETIYRWFLLALFLGKAYLVAADRLRIPPSVQLGLLAALLVSMPPCVAELCGAGGEYLLPTDWWPKCTACLLVPKEVVCVMLYVGAAHTKPFERMTRMGTATGLVLFVAMSLLASWLPGQRAVEFGTDSGTWLGRFARLSDVAVTLLQTTGLVAAMAPLAKRVHFSWAARWVLGSYMFNVNFLDVFFLPPKARWDIVKGLQVGNPVVSGVATWAAMVLPVAFFMLVAAPLLQTALVTAPVRVLVNGRDVVVAMRKRWSLFCSSCRTRRSWLSANAASDVRCDKTQPLLG